MYTVIMGGGRVGLNLASALISVGHDVTLIENDKTLCENAAGELDALVIHGNGTNTKILEGANIGDAKVFVAATGNDGANLLASLLAKDYKVPKIIARVSNPDHEEAFKKAGVNAVISPELTAAGYLEKLITRPKITDLSVIGKGNAELLDLVVNNKKTVGKMVKDVSPTDNYIITAVYKNDELKIPKNDMVLESGDRILVLVKTPKVKKVTGVFTK
jgi:trk system potassium uptake protein TrkA